MKTGEHHDFNKSKAGHTRRQAVGERARAIIDESSDMLQPQAVPEIASWLEKTSERNRDAFGNLLRSIKNAGGGGTPMEGGGRGRGVAEVFDVQHEQQEVPLSPEQRAVHYHEAPQAMRPGTASVMPKSEREVAASLVAAAARAGIKLATPETGDTRLFKGRLLGTVRGGALLEEAAAKHARMLELKKALSDKVYVKCKTVRESWRWFDAECLGYVDVPALHNTIREFLIDCDHEDVVSLHRHMDADGDGVVSFDDFNASLFPLAHNERDYFGVTKRPCLKIANEEMCFVGWDSRGGGDLEGTLEQQPTLPRPATGEDARPRASNFREAGPKVSRGGTPAYMAPHVPPSRPRTSHSGRTDVLVLDSPVKAAAGAPYLKHPHGPGAPALPLGRLMRGGAGRPRSVAAVAPRVGARSVSPSVRDMMALRRDTAPTSRGGVSRGGAGGGKKPADLFMMRPKSSGSGGMPGDGGLGGKPSIVPDALRSDLPNAYWPRTLLEKGFHLQQPGKQGV